MNIIYNRSNMKIENLRKISKNVFNCLENELKAIDSDYECFPKGCCDMASSLLHIILEREGYSNAHIIIKENIDSYSHVWIEIDEFIIDLTAHQFKSIHTPYILIEKNNYPLTNKFNRSRIHNFSYKDWTDFKRISSYFLETFYDKYYKQ